MAMVVQWLPYFYVPAETQGRAVLVRKEAWAGYLMGIAVLATVCALPLE